MPCRAVGKQTAGRKKDVITGYVTGRSNHERN